MIRNERQLGVSRKKLNSLNEAAQNATDEQDRRVWLDLARRVLCEIEEYQAIRDGKVSSFEIGGIDDLPNGLIKARIARKITQAELAARLEVSEQMVQKDEAGGYETARLDRLADVCDALEYELTGGLHPAGPRVLVSNSTATVPTATQQHTIQVSQTPSVSVLMSSPAILTPDSGPIILKEPR